MTDSRAFSTVFGMADSDGHLAGKPIDMAALAVDAVKQGYAVVPLRPGTKVPDICTLTARERKAAGDPHDCGVNHYYELATGTDKVRRDFTRINNGYDNPINLGIVAGPSGLITVDADTEDSVKAFLRDWADAEFDDGYLMHTPTVSTPGAVDANGEWKHKGGGHFHFLAPEGFDWQSHRVTMLRAEGGYDVRWGMQMAVVPPSSRAEGRYSANGDVLPAPAWLVKLVQDRATHVARRMTERQNHAGSDAIARWSVDVTWAELLIPDGWRDTFKVDSCGCPIFEKPAGGSTSDKSATAHDLGCSRDWENAEGHAPLHLWTTDPPEELIPYVTAHGQTLTKFTYMTYVHYDGDSAHATVDLGLDQPFSERFDEWWNESPRESHEEGDSDGDSPTSTRSFWMEHEDDEERTAISRYAKEAYRRERGKEYLAFKRAGSVGTATFTVTPLGSAPIEKVEPNVGHRADGLPLLYRRRVNTIFGPSEAGKSWFSVACLADVAERGGRTLVLDIEDDYDGFAQRCIDVGIPMDPRLVTYTRLFALPSESDRMALIEMGKGTDLIIVDSFDGLLSLWGYNPNDAVGVRVVGAFLKQLAASSGAALILVDHVSEKSDSRQQMGSSAKKQFIDGAAYFADKVGQWKKGTECRTLILAGKDRHGWVKEHAVYETDGDSWGRIAMLSMHPTLGGVAEYELGISTPPDFDDEPSTAPSDIIAIEDAILDLLRTKEGEWFNKTKTLTAAGDRNGRGASGRVLKSLVDRGVIEERDVPIRGGKVGTEYRYMPLD